MPATTQRKIHRLQSRPLFECIALLLQGGGALGAYQGGCYEALAEAGVACNVIAGARHDHILVPLDQADAAMQALNGVWGD